MQLDECSAFTLLRTFTLIKVILHLINDICQLRKARQHDRPSNEKKEHAQE